MELIFELILASGGLSQGESIIVVGTVSRSGLDGAARGRKGGDLVQESKGCSLESVSKGKLSSWGWNGNDEVESLPRYRW